MIVNQAIQLEIKIKIQIIPNLHRIRAFNETLEISTTNHVKLILSKTRYKGEHIDLLYWKFQDI
jgi:hypothetical protein